MDHKAAYRILRDWNGWVKTPYRTFGDDITHESTGIRMFIACQGVAYRKDNDVLYSPGVCMWILLLIPVYRLRRYLSRKGVVS